MDAAIYARLSRKKSRRRHKAAADKESVDVQIAEGRLYANQNNWSVVLILKEDKDISASKYTTKPRPKYNQLIAAIERNEVEVIICTEMTRLYRRVEELLELIKMAERTRLKGIWETNGTGYDLSTADGIHAATIAVSAAVRESAKLSERQKRFKAEDAQLGLPNGGGRPYGFEADGMTIRESEATLLIEAKDRYLAGDTMRDIVRDFCRRGVLSPYGKPWMIENFQRVLFSKRYIGIRVHNDAEYPAQWPALFTQTEWDLMNARRVQRATKYPGKSKGTARKYLLTGLAYCGTCGTYMIGSRRKLADGSYQRRYRCRAVDNHGLPLGCGSVYRSADPLEAFITEVVLYRFDSPEVARALTDEGQDPAVIDGLIANYQAANLRLRQLLAEFGSSDFFTREQFAIVKTAAEDKLQAARDALAKAQENKTRGLLSADKTIREAWEAGGIDFRHSLIKLIVEKVVVHPGVPGSQLWHGWRFDPNLIEIEWKI